MSDLQQDTKNRIVIALTSYKAGNDLIDAIESGSDVLSGESSPASSLGDNGDLYVNLLNGDLYKKYLNSWELQLNVSKGLEDIEQPVGIKDPANVSLSIDDATRTLTVSPVSGSFVCFIKGKRVEISSPISTNWADSHGIHFFYIDASGNLITTTTFSESIITEYAIVSVVYWDFATKKHIYFANERHGIQMVSATHLYLHSTRGAAFEKGCKLVNFIVDASGALPSHAQFNANSGVIWDEDIRITLPAQTQFPVFYRNNATEWKRKSINSYPFIISGEEGFVGTRPAYNRLSAGTWSLAETTNNKFFLVHVFATNDIEYPFIAILGQAEYNSKADARTGAINEIKTISALPVQEFCPVGSVIYEVNNAYSNTAKARVVSTASGADYEDHRGEFIRPGSLA